MHFKSNHRAKARDEMHESELTGAPTVEEKAADISALLLLNSRPLPRVVRQSLAGH
jgi:hypothetical protein